MCTHLLKLYADPCMLRFSAQTAKEMLQKDLKEDNYTDLSMDLTKSAQGVSYKTSRPFISVL